MTTLKLSTAKGQTLTTNIKTDELENLNKEMLQRELSYLHSPLVNTKDGVYKILIDNADFESLILPKGLVVGYAVSDDYYTFDLSNVITGTIAGIHLEDGMISNETVSNPKGANVNIKSNNEMEETPMHTVARIGIPELVAFYISHGAHVDSLNAEFETPLATAAYWTLEMKEQVYSQNHHLICRMLLDYSADINARDEDLKSPLHKAAWNCDHILMQMLLEAGAGANSMDVNGCAPIQYLLKVTGVRPAAQPEICFQLLLNHGAARIYPPQFHKVLESCNSCPKAVEVMVNAYEYIRSTSKWNNAIPKDAMEAHWDFYDSLFAACCTTPRKLMHLARCAVRSALWNKCHQIIPQLTLPPSIKNYLLLEPEGVIY